jgi:hypothetical protein
MRVISKAKTRKGRTRKPKEASTFGGRWRGTSLWILGGANLLATLFVIFILIGNYHGLYFIRKETMVSVPLDPGTGLILPQKPLSVLLEDSNNAEDAVTVERGSVEDGWLGEEEGKTEDR